MSNPYNAPASDVSQVVDDGLTYTPRVLAANGRIGRLRYMAYSMVLVLGVVMLGGIVAAIMMAINPGFMLLLLLLAIPAFVYSILLGKRRLNDRDQSGWWILLMFIPLINLILYLYLIFAPGTAGSNSYGPKPSENTVLVNIGAAIFVLFMIGSFFMPALDPQIFENYGLSGNAQST